MINLGLKKELMVGKSFFRDKILFVIPE